MVLSRSAHVTNPNCSTWLLRGQAAASAEGSIDEHLEQSVGGRDHRWDSGDWGILNTPGASGYAACADFTAFSPVPVSASGLPPGTRICVKTTEGRIGLLKVLRISGPSYAPTITFGVTAWNAQ